MTEETLFDLVRQTPLAERAAILDRECAGNSELRQRVERLLAAHDTPETLLVSPAMEVSDDLGYSLGSEGPPAICNAAEHNFTGTVLAEKYQLLMKLGEGGMGAVWLAQQTAPVKRKVAIKLIKPGMDSEQVLKRFETERQALAVMDHPNIAKVLDGGMTPDGRPFFVMELVKGVPITEYCDENKLTPRQRMELFIPVCQAIQHAHQKGVIHRDIKPSNVLIALYDEKPVPKVIDFGLAKATGQALTDHTLSTALGAVVGTPQYMSPEQATLNNLDIDTRSDVYSLGVLLYELLTGSPPFSKKELEKKGLLEVLRSVREDEPPKPSTKLSDSEALPSISANRSTEPKKLASILRSELDWILLKTLEKDRARRYDSANGFAADLMRYLSGESVSAHPPSRSYRLKKFIRKNRGPMLVVGVVALALVLGIVGMTMGLLRAREAEQAEKERAEGELEAKRAALAAKSIADDERFKADVARDAADGARDAAQRQVVKLDIATATHEADRGEFELALHWAARAWQDDRARMKPGEELPAEADANNRLRVANAIDRLPRLVGFCPHKGRVLDADCDPTGEWAVTLCGNPAKFGPNNFGAHEERESIARVWKTARAELAYPPLQHDRPISAIRFSPDGTYIGTASLDGTARIWEKKTGKLLLTFHSAQPILHLDFRPDGTAFAVATGERIEQIDLQTGKAIRQTIVDGDTVDYAAYSPEGSRLVTVTRSGQARVWDAGFGKALSEPLPFFRIGEKEIRKKLDFSPQFELQRCPTFSSDGRQLATTDGYSILIWSEIGTKTITINRENRPKQISALFTRGDDAIVYIQLPGGEVTHYSLTQQKIIATAGTVRNTCGLAISPDGKKIAVPISRGNTWEFDLPKLQQVGRLIKLNDYATRLRYSRDGRRLLIASTDGSVRILEGGPPDRTLDSDKLDFGRADRLEIPNKSYSHDGKWVAEYVAAQGQLRFGEAGRTLNPLPVRIALADKIIGDNQLEPACRPLVKFNPNRQSFAAYTHGSSGADRQIESWDYSSIPPRQTAAWKAPGNVLNLAFCEDGNRLAVCLRLSDRPNTQADYVSGYQVLEYPSLKAVAPPFGTEVSRLRERMALNHNGDFLAVHQLGTSIVPAWFVRNSERLNLKIGNGNINGIDFGSRDNRLLISQSQTIRQLNPQTGEKVGPTILLAGATQAGAHTAAYSPDQSRFALTLYGDVLIYSAEHGDVLARIASGHEFWLPNIWFSSDGNRVICNTRNSSVVWQSLLPDYAGSWEHVPTLVRLLTGLEADPAGGFSALAPDAIPKDVESYRKAFLAWQTSVANTVQPKLPKIPVRVVHPGRPETRNRTTADFRELHNADITDLENWFKLLPKNFRPSHLTVQEGSNGKRFDAIAVEDGIAGSIEAHLALSAKKGEVHQGEADNKAMGSRPTFNKTLLTTYYADGVYHVHHVWMTNPKREEFWKIKKPQEEVLEAMRKKRLKPCGIGVYENIWAVTAEPDDGHTWEFHVDLTAEQVKQKIDECRKRNWRPTIVHRHRTEGNKFALTLIDNPNNEAWEYEANMSVFDYENKLRLNKTRGFRPEYVQSWVANKEAVYSVIWVRSLVAETESIFRK